MFLQDGVFSILARRGDEGHVLMMIELAIGGFLAESVSGRVRSLAFGKPSDGRVFIEKARLLSRKYIWTCEKPGFWQLFRLTCFQ
jgi:hypothetical protein